MTTTATAVRIHVAGPPEREPADNQAGWTYVQRCLRCDALLTTANWHELGTPVAELTNSGMIAAAEFPTDAATPSCEPDA